MKFSHIILFLCLAQLADAQTVLNPQRKTLTGNWVPTDQSLVPEAILAAHAAAGLEYPSGSCVFSLTLKSTDKKPVRYEQASELRRNSDGTCEMDFDAGDPAPNSICSGTGPDPNSGEGIGGGNGGITAGFADPVCAAVTKLWVGQSFSYDDLCIYSQNAWSGAWQLVQTGWLGLGYQFSAGMQGPCPHCPMGTGYMGASYASATNGTFTNSVFCYALTGHPGVTFTDYSYVSDYGLPGGSTYWSFSSTATGACSVLLHSFFTFT